MKQLLAFLLTIAMVLSMATIGLAADTYDGVCMLSDIPFAYDEDADALYYAPVIEYGQAAYFFLIRPTNELDEMVFIEARSTARRNYEGYHLVTDRDMVDGMRIKMDYEMGEDLVESVRIIKKRTSFPLAEFPMPANDNEDKLVSLLEAIFNTFYYVEMNDLQPQYVYLLEIQTKPQETTSDADVIATVELNKSKRGDDEIDGIKLDYRVKDLQTDIAFNLSYENSYSGIFFDFGNGAKVYLPGDSPYYIGDDEAPGISEIVNGDFTFDPESYYLLKYDYDDVAEFTFGSASSQNEGIFSVDLSGQGKNLLYFNTEPDEAIAAANPDAVIYALNFNNTKFNRTGEFLYESDDLSYAYQLLDDGSLRLLGEFENGEVCFLTRVLGKYLFSDVELNAAAVEAVS